MHTAVLPAAEDKLDRVHTRSVIHRCAEENGRREQKHAADGAADFGGSDLFRRMLKNAQKKDESDRRHRHHKR